MFEFLLDLYNYEDRKVDRLNAEWGFISTCKVSDSAFLFETAIKHEEYNNGNIIIVDNYNSLQEAQDGHNKWVKKMLSKKLPEELIDVSEAGVAMLLEVISDNSWRVYKRAKKA